MSTRHMESLVFGPDFVPSGSTSSLNDIPMTRDDPIPLSPDYTLQLLLECAVPQITSTHQLNTFTLQPPSLTFCLLPDHQQPIHAWTHLGSWYYHRRWVWPRVVIHLLWSIARLVGGWIAYLLRVTFHLGGGWLVTRRWHGWQRCGGRSTTYISWVHRSDAERKTYSGFETIFDWFPA
jgi:hypothetical protein